MNKDRIWTLMSRKLNGEATLAELSELDDLAKGFDETNAAVQLVTRFWQMSTDTEDENDFLEATFHLHTERLYKKGLQLHNDEEETGVLNIESASRNRKSRKMFFVGVACSIMLLAGLIALYYNNQPQAVAIDKLAKSEISTKKGSRSKIQLPDGTTVWLNSSSKLTYDNKNYGNKIREVSLIGEAYFDVVKNKSTPFIIHTVKMDIKVLGTAFNVKCYPGEKTTETSLIRGSVEVTLKDRLEKIMMKPNEKLIINNDDNVVATTATLQSIQKQNLVSLKPIIELGHLTLYPTNNEVVETGWVENKLIFKDEPLEEVAAKMERWYMVTIIIKNEQLKKELLTGVFENENIQQALKALKFTTRFNYKTEKDTIFISK